MIKYRDSILRGTAEDALEEIIRAKELLEEYLDACSLIESDIVLQEDQFNNLDLTLDDLRVFVGVSLQKAQLLLRTRG